MRRSKAFAPRDQSPSGFAAPLGRLCDALPAVAAAVVDSEGETVDYAGFVEPFSIKVAAAEMQLLLSQMASCGFDAWACAHEVVIRARGGTFAGLRLAEHYSLIVQLAHGSFAFSHRALSEAIRELCAEAVLEPPRWLGGEQWLRVDVQDDGTEARRPLAVWIQKAWSPLTVIGRYQGHELLPRELAYRVQLDDGQETTLVRERLGKWYSDHLLLQTARAEPPGSPENHPS